MDDTTETMRPEIRALLHVTGAKVIPESERYEVRAANDAQDVSVHFRIPTTELCPSPGTGVRVVLTW